MQVSSERSIFNDRSLAQIYEEIKNVYQSDNRPWIVGYSGGKDSTAALQLIWYALSSIPRERRIKPVYVIASDTLVETPVIVDRITATLGKINEISTRNGLPFSGTK